MTSLRPSRVRSHILREHESLRRHLDALEELTAGLPQGGARAVEDALRLAQELFEELARHLDVEDAMLAPTLRDDTDAWGPIRAERLLRHHVEQRAQLAAIARRSQGEQAPDALARVLSELIEDLRADMAYEEREVLSPELLRDDVTSSGEDG